MLIQGNKNLIFRKLINIFNLLQMPDTCYIPCTILELEFVSIILGRLENFKEEIIKSIEFDCFKKFP